jgi:hypothetical protein
VPGQALAPFRPEDPADVVRQAPGDGEEAVVAYSSPPGDGGLEKVTGAVQLVGGGEVGEAQVRGAHLEPRVEVAVAVLGPFD